MRRVSERGCLYLGLTGQHVVPHDRGPGTGQLANVGDDHNGQGHCLDTCTHTHTHTRSQIGTSVLRVRLLGVYY